MPDLQSDPTPQANSNPEHHDADQSDAEGTFPRRTIEDRDLRVELEIVRGGPCVMDEIDGDIVGVDVRLEQQQCRADIDVRERQSDGTSTSTKQFTSEVCEYCPGAVYPHYDCIPRYLEVRTGSFVLETYLADTDAVSSLVSELRERCERVTVRSITSTEHQTYAEKCSVDLTHLTPKQREAVHEAKELGYYDPDSRVELGEVAECLDISKSALSQRLQRAEANVLRQLDTECECWRTDE